MDTAYPLDLGKAPAKRSNRDPLLSLMRAIVAERRITREKAVDRWREALADHPDYETFLDQIEEHYALLLFDRCVSRGEGTEGTISREFKRSVRDAVSSGIVLSTWIVPVIGKALAECTFGEVAEVAPIVGGFMVRLAAEGAPGTIVKEVFKTEDELQEFWVSQQLKDNNK